MKTPTRLMPIALLTPQSQAALQSVPETGMGYHFIRLSLRADTAAEVTGEFLVLNSKWLFPIAEGGLVQVLGLTSIKQLISAPDGFKLSASDAKSVDINPTKLAGLAPSGRRIALHTAMQRAGQIQDQAQASGRPMPVKASTSGNDAFLRFCFDAADQRIQSGGKVASGTFATTYRDGVAVTSGLAVVGRYALPVPLAASHVTLLTPPLGTQVELGAVAPNFAQSGGGVEAFFPAAFQNQTRPFCIPDF